MPCWLLRAFNVAMTGSLDHRAVATYEIILHGLMRQVIYVRWGRLPFSHHCEGILCCHAEGSLWPVLAHCFLRTYGCCCSLSWREANIVWDTVDWDSATPNTSSWWVCSVRWRRVRSLLLKDMSSNGWSTASEGGLLLRALPRVSEVRWHIKHFRLVEVWGYRLWWDASFRVANPQGWRKIGWSLCCCSTSYITIFNILLLLHGYLLQRLIP